jgi:carbon-monoxide dehydrogenase small subunit
MRLSLIINGEHREDDVDPQTLLVHDIRDVAGLTGTHVGCETSLCGACTIHLNSQAVKSCTILAVQAEGAQLTTSKVWAPQVGCIPCRKVSGKSTACSAATARRG